MKSKFYKLIFIGILIFSLVGCKNKTSIEINEGEIIGISNIENNNKLQLKVIVDKIIIREEPSINSKNIGIVKKNFIFDVIDYSKDNEYVWFKIKTNNDISGYIASEIESPCIETNKEIDITPPEVSYIENIISVNNREKIESAIKSNLIIKDDIDENPTIEYEIDYTFRSDSTYQINVKVEDSNGNITKANFQVKITGEKQMQDGTWLTYDEMISKQKKAKSLCTKYGLTSWEDAIGCISNDGVHDISIANYTGTTRIGFYEPFTFCNYDKDLNPERCEDGNGNSINHDLISSKLKSLEDNWLKKFRNYRDDVKKTTGYDLYELSW